MCEGLFYAHQRTDIYGNPLNIVHRDITPENIFVSFDGTLRIPEAAPFFAALAMISLSALSVSLGRSSEKEKQSEKRIYLTDYNNR